VVAEPCASLLVVDDEPRMLEFLVEHLTLDRFTVNRATSGEGALDLLSALRPDAAILDVRLPGMSGLDVLSTVRAGVEGPWNPAMPVLIMTGDPEDHSALRAFERGADDVIVKPFSYPALVARLHVGLRRAYAPALSSTLRVGSLTIDRTARRVCVDGRPVWLTPKEYALLAALARDPKRVLSKRRLLQEVWGYASSARTRTVDSHASRLRMKLQQAGARRRYVTNVWGLGYRLLPDA
jgi:DNA-binding response OmpR family regulator